MPTATHASTTVQDEIIRRSRDITTQELIEIHKLEMDFLTVKYEEDSKMHKQSIQAQKELMVSLAELGYENDIVLPGLPAPTSDASDGD